MPKPYRLFSTRPLPADADIVTHDDKPHVRLMERGRPVLFALSKDGKSFLRPSKRWYFDIRDATGTVRRTKGFADKKATEQLAAEMERKVARERAGLIDPGEEHARRPLADHLTDYIAHLEAKGGSLAHIANVEGRCRAMLSGCGFVFPPDLDAAKASRWLTSIRQDRTPQTVPPGESFSPGEVARLFGVSLGAISSSVRRLGLPPATGQGKRRRLPRATVEAIAGNRAQGVSPQTVNHYVAALRSFVLWMVRSKRLGCNPLVTLGVCPSIRLYSRIGSELARVSQGFGLFGLSPTLGAHRSLNLPRRR